MFVDTTVITCKAGDGGKGCHSVEKGRNKMYRRPNGGDGGHGGSIVFLTSRNVHTLLDLRMRQHYEGRRGANGGANDMRGANGEETVVRVPIGTLVYDEKNNLLMKDLCHEDERLIVCRGGQGGKGNHRHAAASPGEPGDMRRLRLDLKLIADVGLIGCPNAGKSTLISHITKAKSRIAAYPFTTKEPVLGVVGMNEGRPLVVADIPGLIEGAHAGKGLGLQFLKHVERTKMFVQLIDMAGTDGRDPYQDYETVLKELKEYSPDFNKRKRVLVANKMDIPGAAQNLIKFKKKVPEKILEISAVTGQGLPKLVTHLLELFSS
jgi:GTPase